MESKEKKFQDYLEKASKFWTKVLSEEEFEAHNAYDKFCEEFCPEKENHKKYGNKIGGCINCTALCFADFFNS